MAAAKAKHKRAPRTPTYRPTPPPKSALLCDHANERPTVCPCEPDCICKEGKNGCLPGKRKSMRDDPEVQSMTNLMMAGRHAERQDILEELEGRLNGTRGWWVPGNSSEGVAQREALQDFKRWLENRR